MSKPSSKSVGQKVGIVADKLVILTQKGIKKIENYATKSAQENQNKNAEKLAATMNRLFENIERNHQSYIQRVELNADELVNKAKSMFNEMKTRAKIAKEKAEKDSSNKEDA